MNTFRAARDGSYESMGQPDTTTPIVSIIMGAYNSASTISSALVSLRDQTFRDWELIVCDDGSSDATLEICLDFAELHPERVRVLQNTENLKLAATLNRCLAIARGMFIARMDADDISVPSRLAKQMKFLRDHPEVDLVGTGMRRFDSVMTQSVVRCPPWPERASMKNGVPFNHATVLAKRTVFDVLGGYSESKWAERCEDRELWFRFFLEGFRGANLAEPLYLVREDVDAFKRRTVRARLNSFRVTVRGFRALSAPVHWYFHPLANLAKAVVPPSLQMVYRKASIRLGSRR